MKPAQGKDQQVIVVRPRLVSRDYERLSPRMVSKETNPHFGNNFVCSICLKVLSEPLECKKCKNAFCSGCIGKWVNSGHSCPFKCNAGFEPLHRILKEQLNELKIACINQGCTESVAYHDLASHYKQCAYSLCRCVFWPDCKLEIIKKDFESHLNQCQFRMKKCAKCKMQIDAFLFDDHDCHSLLISNCAQERNPGSPPLRPEAAEEDKLVEGLPHQPKGGHQPLERIKHLGTAKKSLPRAGNERTTRSRSENVLIER